MAYQRVFRLEYSPDGVFLVGIKIIVAKASSVHAWEGEVGTIVGSQADVVEGVIVESCQPLGPIWIFPDPFRKVLFQLLLRFSGGDGFRLINYAGIIFEGVVYRWYAHIQRVFNQIRGGHPFG